MLIAPAYNALQKEVRGGPIPLQSQKQNIKESWDLFQLQADLKQAHGHP